MEFSLLVRTSIAAGMFLLVFSLGSHSRVAHAAHLIRRPAMLSRALLSLYVVMPLLAIGAVVLFELRPVLESTLLALAVSPEAPFLPLRQLRLVKQEAYVHGLFVISALAAIGITPLAMALIASHLVLPLSAEALQTLRMVGLTVLLPLAVGMVVSRRCPAIAARSGAIARSCAAVLLAAALVPLLVTQWKMIYALIGAGTLLALAGFVGTGLLVGHWLGGPRPEDRAVLALATALRHPAAALAVADEGRADANQALALVLLYLIVSAIVSAPYTHWQKLLRDRGVVLR